MRPIIDAHSSWFLPWELGFNAGGALLVTSPLWLRPRRMNLAVLAAASGLLIDIDHAVVARSLDPKDMIAIAARPPTHSLAFLAVASAATVAATRKPVYGYIVAVGLASHFARDTADSPVPLLWPAEQVTLPWATYPVGVAALFGLSLLARRRLKRSGRI